MSLTNFASVLDSEWGALSTTKGVLGATQGVLGGGSGINSLAALPGLELWLSTKDPADITASGGVVSLWADKSGKSATNAFVSDGAASNTATTATKSLTGNQTFTVDLALTDYTPSADNSIFNKLSGNDGIALLVLTTGVVRLRIGDGASVTNVDSTTGTGVTDLTRCTLGVAWTDGVGASFTLNGAALGTAVAAVKTLTNAATTATIGAALAGVLYRVQVGSSYDFNPSVAARGATTVADGVSGTWAINTSGATGARISGARDLYQGTAASRPTNLPWGGTKYLWNPGVENNGISTPDVSLFYGITGSFDCDLHLAADSWTAGAYLIAKDTATKRTFAFGIDSSGKPAIELYDTGGTSIGPMTSTATVMSAGFTNGANGWVRVRVIWATVGAIRADFYTSTDGVSWTSLGSQQTIAATGNYIGVYDNILTVGRRERSGDNVPVRGKIYAFRCYSGDRDVGGVLKAYADVSETTDGATSWTSSTGEVWTVNTSGGLPATIVGRPQILTDGTNDNMKSSPFPLIQPEWVVLVGQQVSWSADDTFVSGNTDGSMNIGQSPTTPNIVIYAGSAAGQTSQLAVGVTGIITAVFNGASSLLSINRLTPNTGNPGAANGGGLKIGANGGVAGNFANFSFMELAIFSRAPTAADIARVVTYMARKWNIAI